MATTREQSNNSYSCR